MVESGRKKSVAEGQVLFDTIDVRGMYPRGAGEAAAALRILGLKQMPLPSPGTEHFTASRNLETLGHRFFRFNALRTSHKCNSLSKERAI